MFSLSFFIWAIVAYCAYRFLVGFVIPVVRATRQVHGQVKAFQENARQQQQAYDQQQYNTTNYSNPGSARQNTASPSKGGDYIDFEEVK